MFISDHVFPVYDKIAHNILIVSLRNGGLYSSYTNSSLFRISFSYTLMLFLCKYNDTPTIVLIVSAASGDSGNLFKSYTCISIVTHL